MLKLQMHQHKHYIFSYASITFDDKILIYDQMYRWVWNFAVP